MIRNEKRLWLQLPVVLSCVTFVAGSVARNKAHALVDWSRNEHLVTLPHCLSGVYIIRGRLLFRRDFTPVPSRVPAFVYIMPTEHTIQERVSWRVHCGCSTGGEFNSA